jgi:hypothetical protein
VLAGKYGCSVATTHTSGGDEVVAYLNHVQNYLGVIAVGGLSVATDGDTGSVEAAGDPARALGRKLAGAVANGFSDAVQEAAIAGNRDFFRAMVEDNRDFRPEDYKRWERMGWIG